MPISRDDTIWLYASDAFFRNIMSPRYRVEMVRRLQAVADIDLVQLARLAAAGKASPARRSRNSIGKPSAARVRPVARRQPHRAQRRPMSTTTCEVGEGRLCRSSTCPSAM